MGKNRDQWCGPEALDTESSTQRGNGGVSVSRGKVVGADVASLARLVCQGWWRAFERRGLFGAGGDGVLEDGDCGLRRMRYWRAGDSASVVNNMKGLSC